MKPRKKPQKILIPRKMTEAEMGEHEGLKKREIQELGRIFRLVGPLLQIPSLWALTQRPEWASSHMIWIYAGFAGGFLLVTVGLVMHLLGRN